MNLIILKLIDYFNIFKKNILYKYYNGDWGLGIGDWGFGVCGVGS